MQKRIAYKVEELVPVILDLFAEGKKVIISATGNSMAPLIRNDRDSIVLAAYKGEKLGVGDMVFYKRKNGRYVLHRIIDIALDERFITLGDNQIKMEETVDIKQIVALPTTVIRGKKEVSLTSNGYKLYTKLWSKKSVIRWTYVKLFVFRIKLSRLIKKII